MIKHFLYLFLKKIALTAIVFFVLFSLLIKFPTTTYASLNYQGAQDSFTTTDLYKQSVRLPGQNVDKWIRDTTISIARVLTDLSICMYSCDNTNGKTAGAQGMFSNLISYMYTPQISGVDYIIQTASKIPFIKQTIASDGTDTLKPMVYAWTKFRNISYTFLVVIMVAIGFMIMFRMKINPQTVVSVQDSLPKIAVALLFITFSYTICGLFIDIAFLGNDLLYSTITIGGAGATILDSSVPYATSTGGAVAQTTPSAWPIDVLDLFGGANGIAERIVKGAGGVIANMIPTGGILPNLPAQLGFSDFFNSLFALIIAFTVLGSTIRIFLTLLTKYVTILVMVIFMPLAIMWGVLPGQEDTGPKIMKTFLSAALAFPATMLLLALTKYFALASFAAPFKTLPPFYFGGIQAAAAGGAPGAVGCLVAAVAGTCPPGQNIVQNLIAIGLLMMTAQVPAAIDDMLAVKGPGAGAGEEIGGAIRKLPIIGSFLG